METFSMEINGKLLTIETGKMAKQASGSVVIRSGDTTVLLAATVSDKPREGIDFFPLTVDYEERLYAVGRIPGGFIKREGRPTEKAVLTARLTDRPLRPLFPKQMRNAVHIVATVLSVDQDCPPEVMAINAASAALSISKIPFNGPVGAVAVGLIDDKPIINPTVEETKKSTLNLVVAATKDAIMMVEAKAAEVSEDKMLEAIMAGHQAIQSIVDLQLEMIAKVGQPKIEVDLFEPDRAIKEQVEIFVAEKLNIALRNPDKMLREEAISIVKEGTVKHFLENYPENEADIKIILNDMLKKTLRKMIVEEKIRPDGRSPQEIRPISCEVGLLPRTHGSALFTRGQTQVLSVSTLAALRNVQILDGLGLEESKRFIHHYNFPPYSVGETGFMRGPGRREIGHGALVERAMEPAIPAESEFPYTIRVVSEALESNGSTSMASVCATSMSLMDAGVPVESATAGIAMGLVKEDGKVTVLSDIQGVEDFLGDMDFKVAGTRQGITALQMDVKIKGISKDIFADAFLQAKKGYLSIMEKMDEAIATHRSQLSPYAPRIITIQIDIDKIRDVIGPGGRMINKIIADTGVEMDIEPDGKVYITALESEAGEKAKEMVQSLVRGVEPGEIYLGKVKRIEKYGAFVEVLPGKEGLVHISHLDHSRVGKTEDVVKVGDEITVKVLDIDERGRINLSRKEALAKTKRDDYQQSKNRTFSKKR